MHIFLKIHQHFLTVLIIIACQGKGNIVISPMFQGVLDQILGRTLKVIAVL
jgi:hypothetical protein